MNMAKINKFDEVGSGGDCKIKRMNDHHQKIWAEL